MKLISTLKQHIITGIILLVSLNSNAQYCIPAPSFGCVTGDYPSQFSMVGTTSSINDPSLTCAGGFSSSSFGFGGYEDRTAETCAVASPSMPACTITGNFVSSSSSSSSTSGTENCEIYVDWNNDGTFASSERIGGYNNVPSFSAASFNATIPSSIATGYYRMRLCFTTAASDPSIDPCLETMILSFSFPYNSGDAIDYTIYVGPSCTAPTLTLGATTCTSQIINWTAVSGASGYEYVINTTSAAPTGSGTAITATTYTASSLTSGTTYYAHVRTNCGGGSYSPWTTILFTTSGPAAIAGTAALCPSSTTQLSDAIAGGTWTSSATGVATVSTTGLVYGISVGTTNISYTVGGCSVGLSVTVGNMPAIIGNTNVCPGSTTQLSDAVPGGTWTSSATTIATVTNTGLVHTNTNGTTVITYSASGCSTTTTVTVSPLPAITGGTSVCVGSTLPLNDASGGGTWSSSNTAYATISGSGVVTGVAIGSTTIVYTLGSCSTSETVTVGNAISPITGTTTFCVTSSTTLSDATSGGTWSSSNAGVASVVGTVVHGVTSGTATISYSSGGCATTAVVTVDPNNAGTISGSTTVCIGHTITLIDNVPGGTWSSSITTRATVDPATGIVSGVALGSVTIKYTVTNTCGTFTANYPINVTPASPCTTGITAAAPKLTQLSVFPNPNSGAFVMNLSSDIDEPVNVEITNLVGQKVKEFKTASNTTQDIKIDAPPGIYLLTAYTSEGRYVAKIVIEK